MAAAQVALQAINAALTIYCHTAYPVATPCIFCCIKKYNNEKIKIIIEWVHKQLFIRRLNKRVAK